MACNCNNDNKPCGCKDHGLTTPCGYTECSVGNERCDDIQCAECVSYCGTSFQIGGPSSQIVITSGERLDSIIQKFALLISEGVTVCTSNDGHHAPYNLYATLIDTNKLTVVWNNTSSLSTGFNIFYDIVGAGSTGWTQANTTLLVPTETSFEITNLTPTTDYKIKVVSTSASGQCNSVELLITTL